MIRFWDPQDGKPVGDPFNGHRATVAALAAYDAGGTPGIVSGGDDGSVRIWEPPRGGIGESARSRVSPITAVAACNTLGTSCAVTGDDRGRICVWDPDEGRTIRDAFPAHRGAVRVIVPYCDGDRILVASGGDDGVIRFHDSGTGKEVEPALRGHGEPVRALLLDIAMNGERAIVSGGEDGALRFWYGDEEYREIPDLASTMPGDGPVRDLAPLRLSGQNCLAVVGCGRDLLIRGTASPKVVKGPIEAHSNWVMAVRAYPASGGVRLVTSCDDGAIRIWNPQTSDSPELLGEHDGPVRALAIVKTGKQHLIASGDIDGTVRVWDPRERKQLQRIPLGTPVNALCAVDGRLLAGTDEGHLVLDVA